ncbi:histone-fold-containing protein [Powellomyces hirtus]|nr:histone-fold-containing protein [Powellomyces hirtus]
MLPKTSSEVVNHLNKRLLPARWQPQALLLLPLPLPLPAPAPGGGGSGGGGPSQPRKRLGRKSGQVATGGGVRRPASLRPGMAAVQEIRRLQRSTGLLIPRAPFQRVVREIAQDLEAERLTESGAAKPDGIGKRWEAYALVALQEAAEAFVTARLADANLAASHARRVTLQRKDLSFIQELFRRRPNT